MAGEEEGGEFETVEDDLCCHVKKRGEEGEHWRHSIIVIENFPSLH